MLRLTKELVEPGLSGMVSTSHNQDLKPFHQVHYIIRKKDAERCDSTGSTESSEATRVLELLEPGEAAFASPYSGDYVRVCT